MNDQPYGVPAKHWPPKLTPYWFHWTAFVRRRALIKQGIVEVELEGVDRLARLMDSGTGVMIVANHSFHWDSYCLLHVAEKLQTPFYIMSAWQVFAGSNWFERESMQRCGCFSVDREGTDVQSLKTAVDIIQNRRQPLVIFPEGDIYHTNDCVTPFRDGAAAMALMAARKADRPIAILPVALKRWYIDDPTPSLLRTVETIEKRMLWQPRPDLNLVDRVLHLAEGLISSKEVEHMQAPQTGTLSERIHRLMELILSQCENRYQIRPKTDFPPERIKEIRRTVITVREELGVNATDEQKQSWNGDMHKMFLATQLYSYPGNYLADNPSIERVAETIDKLEEDTLGVVYPTVHGNRRVAVQVGEPISVPATKDKSLTPAILTDRLEASVQSLIDGLNKKSL